MQILFKNSYNIKTIQFNDDLDFFMSNYSKIIIFLYEILHEDE